MTPSTVKNHPPAYTPDSDAESLRWWHRALKPSEILSGLALLAALLSVLGFHYSSPSALEARVTTVEKRVDNLTVQQTFTNYMLCDEKRMRDPSSVPQGCFPILQAWGQK